jgi:phytoene dehydrogenase-like protein
MYGWENISSQTGTKRLSQQTPIEGLYLSGHWTLPGSGSLRVFSCGVQCAQRILMAEGLASALPTFAEADLPSIS